MVTPEKSEPLKSGSETLKSGSETLKSGSLRVCNTPLTPCLGVKLVLLFQMVLISRTTPLNRTHPYTGLRSLEVFPWWFQGRSQEKLRAVYSE